MLQKARYQACVHTDVRSGQHAFLMHVVLESVLCGVLPNTLQCVIGLTQVLPHTLQGNISRHVYDGT